MNTNRWLMVVIVVLVLLVLATFRLTISTTDMAVQMAKAIGHMDPPGSVRSEYVPVDTTRPYWGNPAAPVRIVIFSDFECPACAQLSVQIAALKKRYGDSLCISYRHFLLPSHLQARRLAELSEIARRKEVFWELHDTLFADQFELDKSRLERICRGLDLATAPTAQDRQAIEIDAQLAKKLEVSATPTAFVNDRKVVGTYPVGVLEQIIGEELHSPQRLPMMCEE